MKMIQVTSNTLNCLVAVFIIQVYLEEELEGSFLALRTFNPSWRKYLWIAEEWAGLGILYSRATRVTINLSFKEFSLLLEFSHLEMRLVYA